jgi:hypothetical protein
MRAVFALVLVVGMALAGMAVYMIQGYMSDLENALRQEQAFNAKAGKWTYTVSSYSAENLSKRRADLVKAKEEPKKEETKPE